MTTPTSLDEVIDALAREPLRNVVLLKQLLAYRGRAVAHQVRSALGAATLVALDTSVSAYDRQAYPGAVVAAFVASDHPDLTAALLPHLPRGVGIVFKLSREADLAPVAAQFRVERRTAFVSFTSAAPPEPAPGVRVTSAPGDTAFALFETQGHHPCLARAATRRRQCLRLRPRARPRGRLGVLRLRDHRPVWEVGGVVTAPEHRRKGLGARVVRTALAELSRRGLAPRYQVEEHNAASIDLARSVGLAPFLTITHYAHRC